MSSALNSVFGGGGIVGAALNIASVAFPPLGIATSLANMVTQGVGQAVNQAVGTLCREFGMPKFVGDMVRGVVDQVVDRLSQHSDPACDAHVGGQNGVQDLMKDFVRDLCSKIVEATRKNLEGDESCGGGKGKGKGTGATAGSWLQAIAIAMGQIAGDKASQMVELSKKMSDLNAEGQGLTGKLDGASDQDKAKIQSQQQDNAREFSVVQAQFQATSQEFSILQNTFSNALKSIGEGLTTMGRKG
jgi:hypothetical protein